MSATIGDNVQIKEILKATGFDCRADLEGKTFSEATSGGSGGGGEDKLQCYFASSRGIVYTEKPALKIHSTSMEKGGLEEFDDFPIDEGKHLFVLGSWILHWDADYQTISLIYEDGSPATDLKGKFVNADAQG